ncbi:hypothetical protein HRG_003508 [Hirsutella rhossiliensis]|uniref:Uncharacterized protein n=1 Tax=Hirsutella rhossiliensis TaxID=111463 RepID=A0A9P8N218_9HYPO|nr:uncharacterized protein HRG_03508 [Hirsutella rhossiliensis]KAH0965492.1 hypothetical protein HRG_03508 [Hirsutella rhossiliensis]
MPYFLSPAVSVPLKPYPKTQSLPPNQHRAAKQPSRFHRTSSWSGWVRSVLPSHRSERGGTLRSRGFWESEESRQADNQRPRRHVTDSWQSRTSETHGPDHIVRWNTAKDLSETQPEAAQTRLQAEPANACMSSNADPERTWSWAPMDETELCQPQRAPTSQQARPDKVTAATPSEAHAVSTIERRLAQTRQAIEARKEARRQRRDLKESGDYLGVQGINPATGQLDMITPTDSEGNSTSPETQQKLNNLRNALRDARQSYEHVNALSRKEAKKDLESEKDKLRRLEKDKQKLRNFSQRVKWRRQTKQWSSAQEPDLSPIVQSHADSDLGSPRPSTPPHRAAKEQSRDARVGSPGSTSTVIRTPQRQSLADFTPSAWELFENSISFDDSESSGLGQQLGEPAPVPASAYDATQHRIDRGPPARSPDRVAVSKGKTALVQATIPGKAARKLKGSLIEASNEDSFLDKRVRVAVDPGGPETGNWHPPVSTCMPVEESRQTLSKPQCERSASASLPPAKDPSHRNLTERTHRGPWKEAGTGKAPNLDLLTQVRAQKLNARGQSRKWMPPLVYFWPKRTDGSRNQPDTVEEEASPPALPSMASLGRHKICGGREPGQANQGLQEPEAARETRRGSPSTVADMTDSRNKVASMGSSGPETWRMEPIRIYEDNEWVEQALKDITERSNQFVEEFVSTRTTTTTGSASGRETPGEPLEGARLRGPCDEPLTEYLAELGADEARRHNRYYVHEPSGGDISACRRPQRGVICVGGPGEAAKQEGVQHITHINVYAAEG